MKQSTFGLNQVYVSIWQSGNLFAQSQTYTTLLGFSKPDYLGNVLNAAEKVGGISVVAWFEYGNMAEYGGVTVPFALKARDLGWLLDDGQLAHQYAWLNPSNANFVDFFDRRFLFSLYFKRKRHNKIAIQHTQTNS